MALRVLVMAAVGILALVGLGVAVKNRSVQNRAKSKPRRITNLQPCPDCGQSVSMTAVNCPHCGCPV
jgi:hypothetical protein